MTDTLKDLKTRSRRNKTGTEVVQGEGVVIAPTKAGDSTKLVTSDNTPAVTVTDDAKVQIGSGESITQFVDAITEGNPSNSELVPTNEAVEAFVIDKITSGTAIREYTPGQFEAFLDVTTVIEPTEVYVNDTTPFALTDSNNKTVTDVTWARVYCRRLDGEAEPRTIIMGSAADDRVMTPEEIDAAILSLNDRHAFTTARKNIVDSIQTDLTNGLNNKVDEVFGKGLSKHDLTDAYKTKLDNLPANTNSELNEKLDIVSSGVRQEVKDGFVKFTHTTGTTNAKSQEFRMTSSSRLELRTLNDTGGTVKRFKFHNNGNFDVEGSITQGGNSVLDTTDSKYQNLPANTISELANKVDEDGSKILTDVNFSQEDKDKLDGLEPAEKFNGIIQSDSKDALNLKAVGNSTTYSGISWQNSGTYYTGSINREPTNVSNDIVIRSGSSATLDGVPEVGRFKEGAISLELTRGLHANGDIFAFNGGDMAANDITAVGDLQGATVHSTSTLTSDGAITSGSDVYVGYGHRYGTPTTSHGSSNQGSTKYGNIIGNTFSGMELSTTWTGSYNDEKVSFWTHDGGSSAGKRMEISAGGDVTVFNKMAIGANVSPSNALDVYGALYVTGDVLFKATLAVEGADGHDHIFEPVGSSNGGQGIALRTESNPPSSGSIFQVQSSGNSPRLWVGHDTFTGTSNQEMRVGIANDGTGGHPVLTPNNYGDLRAVATYVQNFPSLSTSDVALWFQQGTEVEFIAVGSGTINLPQIVDSNPNSNQVLANSYIYITNSNNGSNIALSRYNSGQKFMIDNISSLHNSATIFSSSRIILKAIDARGISSISENWAWSMRGV